MNHEDENWLKNPVVQVDPDLEDLIPMFMDNRHKDIEAIRSALESGDYETIRSLGHSMKGSGGGYGFHGVSKLGALLEEAAKNGDEPSMRQHLESLVLYMDRVRLVTEE